MLQCYIDSGSRKLKLSSFASISKSKDINVDYNVCHFLFVSDSLLMVLP